MRGKYVALIVILIVAVAVLVGVVVWQPAPPPGEARRTGFHVVVVAIDGLDWFLVEHYADNGLLPSFSHLLTSAQTGEITADRPVTQDNGWTVLARGLPLTPDEETMLNSADDSRLFGVTPDVARLIDEAGGRALAVGWPASWPVRPGGFPEVAAYPPAPQAEGLAPAPALFAEGPGQASAPEIASLIGDVAVRTESEYVADFEREILEGLGDGPNARARVTDARWAYVADRISLDVGVRLLAEEEPDVALIYLGGLDAVERRFLAAAMPDYFPNLPPSEKSYADVVPNYYRFVDRALRRIRMLADERTIIFVCSAFGTHPSGEVEGIFSGHELGAPGVFIAWGQPVRRSPNPITISTLDVAPTILAATGFPIPDDLEGHVLLDILPEKLPDLNPPTYVTRHGSYAVSQKKPKDAAEMDELVAARLRAIEAALPG
jgi:hypothetical protein